MDVKKHTFKEIAEKIRESISRIFWTLFLLVIFPALALLAYNFFKMVILGHMTMSQFKDSFSHYSYGPVVEFYDSIRQWIVSLIQRLRR
jgi:hypothetical protein